MAANTKVKMEKHAPVRKQVKIKSEPTFMETMTKGSSKKLSPVTPVEKLTKPVQKPLEHRPHVNPQMNDLSSKFFLPQVDDDLDVETPTRKRSSSATASGKSKKKKELKYNDQPLVPVSTVAKTSTPTPTPAVTSTTTKPKDVTPVAAASPSTQSKAPQATPTTVIATPVQTTVTTTPATSIPQSTSTPEKKQVKAKPVVQQPPKSVVVPVVHAKPPPPFQPVEMSLFTNAKDSTLSAAFSAIDDAMLKEKYVTVASQSFDEWISHGVSLVNKQHELVKDVVMARVRLDAKFQVVFEVVNNHGKGLESRDVELKEKLQKLQNLGKEIKQFINC